MDIKQKILIVDDRPENLYACEKILSEVDAEIIKATDGNDALRASLHNDFALAILDVKMPKMDGYELAEFIRNEDTTRDLPIIFLSAVYTDESHIFKGYESGAVDFFTKPFNPKLLLSKVKVFLSLDRQKKRLEELVGEMKKTNEQLNHEIAERKQAEEALKQAEQEKETILDSLLEHVVYQDIKMRVLWANRAACESVGTTREELVGRHCYEIWAERHSPCEDCPVAKVCETGHPQAVEKTTSNGRSWYIQGYPVRDGNGDILGMVELTLEITERKQAEEALRRSEQKFKDLTETTTDWVWEVDAQGVYTYASPRIKDLLGYEVSKVLGKTPFDLMPKKEAERIRKFFDKKVTNRETFYGLENVNRHKDGHLVVLETNGIPILDEKGQLKGYRGIDRNITERKRAEEALQKAHDELEQRVKERTAELVTANKQLSQEIEERRRAEEQIRSLSQQLLKAQESERQRLSRDLHDTVGGSLSALKIGCDTLFDDQTELPPGIRQRVSEFSKVLQGSVMAVRDLSYDLRPASLDQLGLVETVVHYCGDFSERNALKVDFFSVDLDNIKLDFDTEIALYRIIQEGLNNIRKHAHASHVTIRLLACFPHIILRIEDNGKGFDVEKRSREAFQEKRMGLQTMRERAALLNGKMKIESHLDKGTKILVEVPYKGKNIG